MVLTLFERVNGRLIPPPNAERPYRAWGYPVVPALFLLVTAWLLINTLLTAPRQALIGLVLIALRLPVYAYWTKASKAAQNSITGMR